MPFCILNFDLLTTQFDNEAGMTCPAFILHLVLKDLFHNFFCQYLTMLEFGTARGAQAQYNSSSIYPSSIDSRTNTILRNMADHPVYQRSFCRSGIFLYIRLLKSYALDYLSFPKRLMVSDENVVGFQVHLESLVKSHLLSSFFDAPYRGLMFEILGILGVVMRNFAMLFKCFPKICQEIEFFLDRFTFWFIQSFACKFVK